MFVRLVVFCGEVDLHDDQSLMNGLCCYSNVMHMLVTLNTPPQLCSDVNQCIVGLLESVYVQWCVIVCVCICHLFYPLLPVLVLAVPCAPLAL